MLPGTPINRLYSSVKENVQKREMQISTQEEMLSVIARVNTALVNEGHLSAGAKYKET